MKKLNLIGAAFVLAITIGAFAVTSTCQLSIFGISPNVSSHTLYVHYPPYEGTQYRDWPVFSERGRLAIAATNWVTVTLFEPVTSPTAVAVVESCNSKGKLTATIPLVMEKGCSSGMWSIYQPRCGTNEPVYVQLYQSGINY